MADIYADHAIPYLLVTSLRELNHDVLATRDIGQEAASDGQQLLTSASLNRILISHHRDDFALLHNAWHHWTIAWGVPLQHAGIIVIAQQVWSPEIAAAIIDEKIGRSISLVAEMHVCDKHRHWTERH